MTFKNTVFVEEFDGDRVLRSAHDEFPVSSVIRRRTYIKIRRRREQSGGSGVIEPPVLRWAACDC